MGSEEDVAVNSGSSSGTRDSCPGRVSTIYPSPLVSKAKII